MFLQAATGASTAPAASCLRLAERGKVKLLLSPSLLSELTDVLSRPALRKKFRMLSDETAAHFLAHAVSCAEALPEPPKAFTLPRDPDDEPYLNLAIAGKAESISSLGTNAT
jgi:putative PIN family toxin of toxin-antitoxin system